MTITALPTPPSRSDPANFAVRGDAFLGALPLFQAEANDLANTVNKQYNTVVIASEAAGGIAVAVNTASAAAAEATVAKDQAVLAWNSAMSPAETLPIISKSIHVGSIVKGIIYDTSKDSDEGEWRERCQDKSWYTETLGGDRWIGQQATIVAAWTAAGSATGAVFQASATAGPLTVGKYYSANSATTATEVFRGVAREFPAVAGIVAESARVVIYDLSTGAMWMSLIASVSAIYWWGSSATVSALAARDGMLCVGSGAASLYKVNFVSDSFKRHSTANIGNPTGPIASRHGAILFQGASEANIVALGINDVAITVLDNAPIDPATGLPVPTIAVATAGGVSVIKQDGTVANHAFVGYVADRVNISKDVLRYSNGNNLYGYRYIGLSGLPSTFAGTGVFTSGSYTTTGNLTSRNNYAVANSSTLMATLIQENPSAPTKSMIAAITPVHNSGWQVGDSRGAYLADTTAETITASGELVTNGTFTTDTTGWTAGQTTGTATITTSSGQLVVSNNASATYGRATASFPTVVGKAYLVTAAVVASSNTAKVFVSFTATDGGTLGSVIASSGDIIFQFTATTTTSYVGCQVQSGATSATATFDNISVKLAEPDRSVKNKGLVVNGTLTKTAVASGAGLVRYSGFSASNYLEQPYNSDLDFGTGDFCVMGWVKNQAASQALITRSASAPLAGGFVVQTTATNQIQFLLVDNAGAFDAVNTTAVVDFTNYIHVIALRRSGVVEIWASGSLLYSGASTRNISSTSLNAVVRVGTRFDLTNPTSGSLALWRISATAPSADQIAHIYRTELPLFQANAQCTIAGTSTAVTALAYDDSTDLLHVGTSWGRSGFKDLLRVDSEATTTGSITSLSATKGSILTSGTSGKYYQPAVLLREELNRKDTAAQALGKVPVFFDFDAVTSQVLFTLPKGYTTKAVYSAGTLKRVGSTKDYTTSTDGFSESVTFAVAPGNTVWVSVMAVRSN